MHRLVAWSNDNLIAFSTREPLYAPYSDESIDPFWACTYPLYLIKPDQPQEVHTGMILTQPL